MFVQQPLFIFLIIATVQLPAVTIFSVRYDKSIDFIVLVQHGIKLTLVKIKSCAVLQIFTAHIEFKMAENFKIIWKYCRKKKQFIFHWSVKNWKKSLKRIINKNNINMYDK